MILIQAVVYDAVGTLIHVRPSVAAIYAQVGQRFSSRVDAESIAARFRPAFARQERIDEQAGWRTSEERELERWRAIVAEVLDDVTDVEACFAALYAAFGESAAWSCDPDAQTVIVRLQQRGVRQALASNFDRRLSKVIAGMPPLAALAPVVVSSQVGWRKPAPEFFRALADALHLEPSAILYVGDDRGNDLDGARKAGMHTLLLDPHRRHLDLGPMRIDRLLDVIERAGSVGDGCWHYRR